MAIKKVSTPLTGIEGLADEARFVASVGEDDPTLPIPRSLMLLAARGEVTLRVLLDLADEPASAEGDSIPIKRSTRPA
ncbi:MAG TPA: hypothetical protein VMR54_05920 [Thermoanaerobaculia bacterium]|nr:hypothetical protein [Thermoanaerobaculia bacterium]